MINFYHWTGATFHEHMLPYLGEIAALDKAKGQELLRMRDYLGRTAADMATPGSTFAKTLLDANRRRIVDEEVRQMILRAFTYTLCRILITAA